MHVSPAIRDYQESVTNGQTDTRTDRRTDRCKTEWSICAAMLCRRHKTYTLSAMIFLLSYLFAFFLFQLQVTSNLSWPISTTIWSKKGVAALKFKMAQNYLICLRFTESTNTLREGLRNPLQCQKFAIKDEACRVVDVANLGQEDGIPNKSLPQGDYWLFFSYMQNV